MANSTVLVNPTSGVPGRPQYSDSSLVTLFSAHENLFAIEHQLFWLRGSAILVANTILFAGIVQLLIKQKPEQAFPNLFGLPTDDLYGMAACGAGMVISLVWCWLIHLHYKRVKLMLTVLRQFEWEKEYYNPFMNDEMYHIMADPQVDFLPGVTTQWFFKLIIFIFYVMYGISFYIFVQRSIHPL
ncbi:MAG: hypothetical protein JO249_00340 [Acidobacteria bacterium]|nr:hypothetical protein [Acidobacteriota bacterium]